MADSFNPLEHIDSYVEAMPWTLEALNDYIEPIYSQFYSFITNEFVFTIPTLSNLEVEFLSIEFNKQSDNKIEMNDLKEIFNDFMDPIWIPDKAMPMDCIADDDGSVRKDSRRDFQAEYQEFRAKEDLEPLAEAGVVTLQ